MTTIAMLKDYRVISTSTFGASDISVSVASYTSTAISIRINKFTNSRRCYRVAVVVIMADSSIYSGNSSIYFDDYDFRTSQSGLSFSNVVGGYGTNFGIDSRYKARGNLDQQCLLGLYRIWANFRSNKFYADMTTDPIDKYYSVNAFFYDTSF